MQRKRKAISSLILNWLNLFIKAYRDFEIAVSRYLHLSMVCYRMRCNYEKTPFRKFFHGGNIAASLTIATFLPYSLQKVSLTG